MTQRNNQTLLLLLCLAVAGVAGSYLLFGTEPQAGAAVDNLDAPQQELGSVQGPETILTTPPRLRIADEKPVPTTVIWPLEIELDMIRPNYLPATEEGVQPGIGRRSRMGGRIANGRGDPVQARIEFVAGANQGRILVCGSDGAFGAGDLYPGLAIVEVSGVGIVGSRREIVLRQNAEYTLNIGYGRPGGIEGEVLDAQGEGIEGASVFVDGLGTSTNAEGYFFIGGLASDRALLEIEARGYSSVREVVGITANYTIPRGRLVYRLERGANLEISLLTAIGEQEKAQVIVLPADTKQQRRYPWYRLNPIEITPGSSIRVDDLPVGPVAIRVFHRGAVASPRERVINLRSGGMNRVEIELRPAPVLRGTITRNGEPVPGAKVKLEAPDRVGAVLSYFRTAHWFLESEILPPFPFAVQEVRTDAEGQYLFTAWSEVAETRYLEAWSPDGTAWGGRMVGLEDLTADLELAELNRGTSELHIELPDRIQGLEVKLTINGTPAEAFNLAPERELVVDSLLEGTWRLKAVWYTDVLIEESSLKISGSRSVRADLPARAIEGEAREAWERAGKSFPKGSLKD